MQSTQSISVKNLSQSAQTGDYWLISAELLEPLNSIDAFYFLDKQPEQTLSLFHYQFPKLQLLSQQPLTDNLLNSETLQLTSKLNDQVILKSEQPTLLLASDLGIGPLFYYAKQVKTNSQNNLALLHASASFPFAVKPAQFMLENFPHEAIGACSLLEDWKIANRLASDIGLPGCFEGSLVDLFDYWLSTESQHHLKEESRVHWQVLSFLPERCNQQLKERVKPYPWLSLQTINTP
ncbi:MAG: hypothetical protein U9R28_07525 [Pseudomonadota bacterium]|nr:hypothetical protein [Pseudomonadota bacterium]